MIISKLMIEEEKEKGYWKEERWGGRNKKLSLHYCTSQNKDHTSSESLERKKGGKSQRIEEWPGAYNRDWDAELHS